jgi:uncharacterized membrane protein YeaQ/YmgE (transglycosylase-associated protein family)
MVAFIVLLLIIGLIVGMIARLLVPGRDNIGIFGTIVLGIAGSLVGGFLATLIEYHKVENHVRTVGIVGSILGAVVLLIVLRITGLEPGRSRR